VRILAIDYGARRCGLAISDETETLAFPIEAIDRVGTPTGMDALVAVVDREAPALIVVGLPRTQGGVRGGQAQATAAFVGRLRKRTEVPLEWEDERFTTSIATRSALPESASSLDSRSAAVLLQSVLDRRAAER
jgi:putative Holliday junction resolvase